MDMKPPSAAGKVLWENHLAFLRVAAEKNVYVKLVTTAELSEEELLTACRIIAKVGKNIPLVLQPVTPRGGSKAAGPEKLLRFQALALSILGDVRLIPQAHKAIGIR